jgi:hydrogenase maturation protein HypF
VLLRADGIEKLPEVVAPGLATLGFMLPTTPMHLLMLRRMNRPVVMTSGNLSDEPQVISDQEAAERLRGVATYVLTHNREIANRIDDSVACVVAGCACCAGPGGTRPSRSLCRGASKPRLNWWRRVVS